MSDSTALITMALLYVISIAALLQGMYNFLHTLYCTVYSISKNLFPSMLTGNNTYVAFSCDSPLKILKVSP
jgi:hypothetical protein